MGNNDNEQEPMTWNVYKDYGFDTDLENNSMLEIGIGDMEVTALVDTGAMVSVLSGGIIHRSKSEILLIIRHIHVQA